MARKKKSKADPAKKGGAKTETSVAAEHEGGGEQKAAPAKKRTPRKKRARKKAKKQGTGAKDQAKKDEAAPAADRAAPNASDEPKALERPKAPKKPRAPKKPKAPKKPEAEAPEAPEAEPAPPETPPLEPVADDPAEDLGVDLDLDVDGPEDLQSLVSEVAVLDATETAADDIEVVELIDVDEAEEGSAHAEVLDAVLDDESGDSADLAELIAQTVAGADPEDFGEPPSAEPLDEGPPLEVLDERPVEAKGGRAPEHIGGRPQGAEPPTPAAPATSTPEPATEHDLEGAIDLGPASTPELRDRLLAQALAHSEMQDARYRVPFSDARRVGRWKGAVAAVLLLIAAILALAPPAWVRPEPPAQIDASGRARGIRAALLLQAQQVDAYRVRFQRLPDSLTELPAQLPGVRFVKSGNRAYQLIAYEVNGNAIIYDSSNPAPQFERLVPSWTPELTR